LYVIRSTTLPLASVAAPAHTSRCPGGCSVKQVVRPAVIDPETRRVVKEIDVSLHGFQSGIFSLAAGAGGVWVANAYAHRVVRIDPKTNRITATIPIAGEPHGITVGGGSVWVSVGRPGTI
jgi:virginiamycin B lyase